VETPMVRPDSVAVVYPVEIESLPTRVLREGRYEVGFARSREELDEILRLRFEVFNLELGEGLETSYETGRDEDRFDVVCHHLYVRDTSADQIVGCYRLQTREMADQYYGFYSDDEYDLSAVPSATLDQAVELGRACVARSHRTSQVLFLLWKGLALYVAGNEKRYLFGCSSLTSQDPVLGQAMMRYFEREGHVHPELRLGVRPGFECRVDAENVEGTTPEPGIGRKDVPILFRTYLRYGAKVCSEPAIDGQFKTIDYLVMIDVDQMPRRVFRLFSC